MSTQPPSRPLPPPMKSTSQPPKLFSGKPTSDRKFIPRGGTQTHTQRTGIYGEAASGKSSLAADLKKIGINPLFLDIGNSTTFLNVDRLDESDGLATWDDLRSALQDDSIWNGYQAVVIDDMTKAQELCELHVIANSGDSKIKSIEGFGYGKGLTYVYETFLQFLGDLDRHIRLGRHVVCIAHSCTTSVPNPSGEDWLRHEPRLQSPASGKNSIRHRVIEWLDHMIYIGYDTHVSKDGKGMGSGSRTIYPVQMASHLAKSRLLADPIVYQLGSTELWQKLFNKEHEHEQGR